MNQANWVDTDRADRALMEIQEGGLDKWISSDPSTPYIEEATRVYEDLKRQFNLTTQGDLDDQLANMEAMQRQQVEREIRAQIDEFGVETILDALEHHDDVSPEAQQRVDDVLADLPPDVYDEMVEEQLVTLVNRWREDITMVEEGQLDAAERRGRRLAERQLLDRIGRRLGINVNSADDVMDAIEDRLANAGQSEATRSGTIRMRHRASEDLPDVRFDGSVDFTPWRSQVRERIMAEMDWRALREGSYHDVGIIRTVDGELSTIDLARGREKAGATGPAAAPARVAGWLKTSETTDRVEYHMGNALVRAEGVTATRLVVEHGGDGGTWHLVRLDVTADDEVVSSTEVARGMPDRDTALDRASFWMQDHPFDPDARPLNVGPELEEVLDRAQFSAKRLYEETDAETFDALREAIDAGDLPREDLSTLVGVLDAYPPADLSTILALEQDDDAVGAEFSRFLGALPDYDPPSARGFSGAGEVEYRSPQRQAAFNRIRDALEHLPGAFKDDPQSYYDRWMEALMRGDASGVEITQTEMDRLSTKDREDLRDVARSQYDAALDDAGLDAFPSTREAIKQARTSNRAFVKAVIDEIERERDPERIDADEIERLGRAPRAKKEALDQLKDRINELDRGGSQGNRYRRGSGGGSGGPNRGQDPGMSDDEFQNIQDEADRRGMDLGGGPTSSGGGGRGGGGGGRAPGGRRRDESRLDGTDIERWHPAVEEAFSNVVRDLGWLRKFDMDTNNLNLYFQLTPAQQRRHYDFTPASWLAYQIRSENIEFARLRARNLPPELLEQVTQELEEGP